MLEERKRVMVVDDEKSVSDLLERILREMGYDVVTAAEGQEPLTGIC